MKNRPVVIFSHFPLPYDGIGSWTVMYDYYLSGNHVVDAIICPKPSQKHPSLNYLKVNDGFVHKINRKINRTSKYTPHLKTLQEYITQEGDIILHVIDNPGFILELHQFLEDNGLREKCYIQFGYHGFRPFYDAVKAIPFLKTIDEFLFLTEASKEYHLEAYPTYQSVSTVLHNGVDKTRFKKDIERNEVRFRQSILNKNIKIHNDSETCVYLWLSRDVPKKGLDLILGLWDSFHKDCPKSELWIIGSERDIRVAGVRNFGKLPNNELPKYYRAADVYLFPTLCEEGFGLSLVEALSCGCYAIASAYGGVPEVLRQGTLGVLIERPEDVNLWIKEMKQSYVFFMSGSLQNKFSLAQNTYSIKNWCEQLSEIIINAQQGAR